jgi:peptidoglycan/LPS O-acetylase OafA/YrhL
LPGSFTYLSSKGSFGVQLFFIASAFTLFLSYSKRSTADKQATVRNFFIRRLFRISPMYYLAALMYGVICYYLPEYNDGHPLKVGNVLINMLYLNTFIPGTINYLPPGGWSVGAEMVFYCFVPFLFSRIKSLKAAVQLFLVLLAGSVVLQYSIRFILTSQGIDYRNPETWFLYYWFPNQAAVFILGIILFFAGQKYTVASKVKAAMLLGATVALLGIFILFGPSIVPHMIVQEHFIVAIFFTGIVFLLSQHHFVLFDNKLMRFLGEISFSLYLIHFAVLKFFEQLLPASLTGFSRYSVLAFITFTISSLLSWITYRTVESKGIEWGNKLIKKYRKNQVTPPVAVAKQLAKITESAMI